MPKKRRAEAAQAALGDEAAAPPTLEIDGAGWHVRTIALGYYRADLSQMSAEKLAASLKARYPRAAVQVTVAARYGDRVVSSLLAPLRLVSIGADDEDGARARIRRGEAARGGDARGVGVRGALARRGR